jgi:hypothetical protein
VNSVDYTAPADVLTGAALCPRIRKIWLNLSWRENHPPSRYRRPYRLVVLGGLFARYGGSESRLLCRRPSYPSLAFWLTEFYLVRRSGEPPVGF